MKHGIQITYMMVIIAIAFLSSCMLDKTEKPKSSEEYSKIIMYSVDANNAYFEDLEDEDFTEFGKMGEELIQDVLDGKLKAYHPFDPTVEMTMEEIKHQLFAVDTLYIENPETYELEIGLVEHDYTKDVQSLKFKERWKYEPGTGVIDKQAIAIAPRKAVIDYETRMIRGYTSLFWVNLD